jgi:membrane associated rhomboid family serine protease
MVGPSADTLILMGAKQTSLIVVEKQWYRLFSPMVLHAGIIHYLLNMLALWFIGSAVEQNHGFFAAALLFIVPAFGGTVLSALFLPEYISVGASGGIFGLIGACLADIVGNWNLLFSKEVNSIDNGVRFRHAKVLLWLLLDIIVNILIGMTPFVDNFTHLGGMVYGFLFGLSALERLSKAFFGVSTSCFSNVMAYVIKFAGAIISIVCIIVSVVILFSGSKVTCRGCRYVSCVPFPFWADQEDRWWYCDDCELVTAEAVMNEATQYYSSLNLTCPDKAVVSIDLTKLEISDGHWLEKQLPTYCRRNCEQVYN